MPSEKDASDAKERFASGGAQVPPVAVGKPMKPKMKREHFTNVWDALEDDPAVAANMTMRSDLLIALQRRVGSWKTSQTQAARRLEITQPRLNDLLRGRINKFSLDMLVNLAKRADIRVSLRVDKAA